MPGPGSYTQPDCFDRKSFNFTSRKSESIKDNFPGPGSYQIATDRSKSPG